MALQGLFYPNKSSSVGANFGLLVSPKHKRTKGRAPVWGSDLLQKDAALQGGDPAETAANLQGGLVPNKISGHLFPEAMINFGR